MARGNRLNKIRLERGLTAQQLAKAAGVWPGQVYRWESGAMVPDVASRDRLAEALGVHVDEIFPPRRFKRALERLLEAWSP